jgi:radical SAM-linked protein
MQADYVQRLRITFSKFGPTRYIGHLDLARTWERALNRAKIPMSYSQGFNSRPRMQLAAPLPLGYTSECEIVDLWLKEALEPATAAEQIMATMAPGIAITAIEAVPLSASALQTLTLEATYVATLPFEAVDSAELQRRVTDLLSQDAVIRPRRGRKYRGKTYDLRPLIIALTVIIDEEGQPALHMRLHLSSGKTGRPDELLDALGFDPLEARIHRQTLLLASEDSAADSVAATANG